MGRQSNVQFALKPQDLFVLLALLVRESEGATYPDLAAQTGLAPSAAHASLRRAAIAGLVVFEDRRPVVLKPELYEFVVFGAKYAFPAVHGRLTQGVPTAHGAAPLSALVAPTAEPLPVWPYRSGSVRGASLAPLYPTVPEAALRDSRLYGVLSLFDALRSGQAPERGAAWKLLEDYFH